MLIISVEKIQIAPNRQRQHFPEVEMDELAESIFNTPAGLINPIMVRPADEEGTYFLLAGERRFRVISERNEAYHCGNEQVPAGHIPAIVYALEDYKDQQLVELHENVMRLDLTWQERVEAIKRLNDRAVASGKPYPRTLVARAVDKGVEDEQNPRANPSPKAYRKVAQALTIANYLDDPEVNKAATETEALRIATRKLEQQIAERLMKVDFKAQQKPAESGKQQSKAAEKAAEVANLDFDLDLPARTKIGKLLIGDFRDYIKDITNVACVVADPPYGMDADKFKDGGHSTFTPHEYRDDKEAALDIYYDLIQALSSVCQPNAHAYIFCRFESWQDIVPMFADTQGEWTVRPRPLIWNRGGGKILSGHKTGYNSSYDTILVAMRGDRSFSATIADVISCHRVAGSNKVHGAQKPVEVYKTLLQMSCIPGDLVLDPMCGSGTIFEAARELGLDPIGIELSEQHAAFANQRRS